MEPINQKLKAWVLGIEIELLYLIVLINDLITNIPSSKYHILIVVVVGMIFKEFRKHYAYWIALSCMLIISRIVFFYYSSNHSMLLTALSLCFLIYHYQPNQKVFVTSLKWLIAFPVGMSVLQKALVPDFLSGSTFTWFWIQGAIFDHELFRWLYPDRKTFIELNNEVFKPIFTQTNSLDPVKLALDKPWIPLAMKYLTWATIIFELVLTLTYILNKQKWMHIATLSFLWITAFVTMEFEFFCIVAFMGFAICSAEQWRFKLAYIATIIVYITMNIPINSTPV